jgi:hypothetical protein
MLLEAIQGSEALLEELGDVLIEELIRGTAVVYDPNLGEIGRKAFVDINRVSHGTLSSIDTPKKFSQLVTEAFNRVAARYRQAGPCEEKMQVLLDQLEAYFQSNRFLNVYALLFAGISQDITPANLENALVCSTFAPLEHQKTYRMLPWQLSTGANTMNSLCIINGVRGKTSRHLSGVNTYCQNGEDVLSLLETFLYTLPVTAGNYDRMQGAIPKHAINFFFTDPRLRPLIEAVDKKTWTKEYCIQPAERLNQRLEITESAYKEVREQIWAQLKDPCSAKWARLTAEGPPEWNLAKVHQFLSEKLALSLGSMDRTEHSMFSHLDSLLYKQIPVEERAVVPFLPFIDSNWYDATTHKDIYWGLWYSPMTLQWELWQTSDDFSEAKKVGEEFFSLDRPYQAFFYVN